MEHVVSYFRSIVIFLIFMNFVSILLPNKKYKGYIDFVLGLILISIVISPVTKLLKIDAKSLNSEFLTKNAEQNTYTSDTRYTLELYEKEVGYQVSALIEKNFGLTSSNLDVTVSEEDFSTIESISLTVHKDSIYIEPVNIGSNPQNKNNVGNIDIKNIKNVISSAYNLSVDNININIGN